MTETHYLPHEYPNEPKLRDLPRKIWNWPRLVVLGIIRLYQMTLSRLMPANSCRFYPSCSHYGYQVIYKYGVIKGGLKAGWRVLRCNPFNPGGFDPVL
jgi:putative membrane protein insertion efficiency factor